MSDFNPRHLTMSPPAATSSKTNKSSMPMLYYGLAMVGAAAIALILYNLITIITKMWNRSHLQSSQDEVVDVAMGSSSSMSFDNSRGNLLSSFKYKKGAEKEGGSGDDYECSVCLSDLEEGEEVKKLPRCKHSFHVQCIDMWLHSHHDCPVCRTPLDASCHHFTLENVPQVMLATGGILV